MVLGVSSITRWVRQFKARFVKKSVGSPKLGTELVSITDQKRSEVFEQAISPQVFQTAPSREIGSALWKELEAFRSRNRHLDFCFFDEAEVDTYMSAVWGDHAIYPIYASALFGQMKADIWRYCIVWERGGYYLDINKSVNSDLRLLHSAEASGFVSFERNSVIVLPDDPLGGRLAYPEKVALQWSFGFKPRHPILKTAIDRIVSLAPYFEQRVFDKALGAVVAFTGPGTFTWALRKFFENSTAPGVAQLSPDFDGLGITRLPDSESAFRGVTHYSKWRDCPVLGRL